MLCLELFTFLFRIHVAQLLAIFVALLHGHQLAAIDRPLPRRYEILTLLMRTLQHLLFMLSLEFFAGLNQDFLDFLSEYATEKTVKKGEVLFQQGKTADKFYLLRNGCVSVQVPALVGPPLELQVLGENQILGWSWLIAPFRWNFQARVTEDAEICEFDGAALRDRCERDPRLGYDLLKRFAGLMSERLEAARQKMIEEWNPPGFA